MCTLYFVFGVSESPKWLYINEMYDRAREVLIEVGNFNGISGRRSDHLAKMTFDIEVLTKLKEKTPTEGEEVKSKFSK